MSVRSIVRRTVRLVLSLGDIDLRSVRWRLESMRPRHAMASGILSVDDSPGEPNERLLDIAEAAIKQARTCDVSFLLKRGAPAYVTTWPGEHYRLLQGLILTANVRHIVEVGTYTGLSALAMKAVIGQEGSVTTFDLVPWQEIAGTFLRPADFEDSRLVQVAADLGDPLVAGRFQQLLRQADLIFLDAAKDGRLEARLLANFTVAGLKPGCLLVFDDVRDWNMLKTWREISMPKLDLVSFGHWTGTDIVLWDTAAP